MATKDQMLDGGRLRVANGFTMVEVLVVLAILAVLAALLFPVYQSSKNSAGKVVSYSKLKQSHLGLMLYREDNGGETGYYGRPSQMNLPTDHSRFTDQGAYGVDWKLRRPGGCSPWIEERGLSTFIFSNLAEHSDWPREAVRYQEGVMIFGDVSCNPKKDSLATEYLRTKTSTGVFLSGQIKTHTGRGDVMNSEFYHGESR
ncbi:MAG TPA: hypothetical protein DCY02_02710 [Armatimonadetes bacterium]|nr:hypothetical protein [Armatimonadota bacterium]HRD30198.1 prepilin-type N-terminal cleavage/methylation domain-containing protein [Fimbriimonadaceae bacterium]HRE94485.1 prepilin-type N-terminal cleavage/methylation domain-containing protein [Fimbriimonadaceae bacterium]